jgi:hypothetical protein
MTRKILLMALAALLLVSCSITSTIPRQTGLALHNVNVKVPAGEVYTVVEVDINAAAAMSEPYPSRIAYIWAPAEEPRDLQLARKSLQAKKDILLKLDKNSSGYKEALTEYNQASSKYLESYNAWSASATPRDILKAPGGQYFKAVGISFKDRSGNFVEVCKNGVISAPPEMLSIIEPYYGGKAKVLINRSFKFLVDNGYRISIMGNDNTDAKRVYNLDGFGVNGEKWGTVYASFNPQAHGTKFSFDNPRMYEVQPGSVKEKEFVQWNIELLLKAAIVAYRKDALEFHIHPSLEEFKGFALDPWSKLWVERKTSRTEAVRQALSEWEFGPMVFYDFKSFGAGFMLSKLLRVTSALFGDRQYFIFGSAGSPVTRYDWAVGQLESAQSTEVHKIAYEKNKLVAKYNKLAIAWSNEHNVQKKEEMQKEMDTIAATLTTLTSSILMPQSFGNPPNIAVMPGSSGGGGLIDGLTEKIQ